MLLCCEAKTQTEYIINGSFEDYSSCPNAVTQISKCNNWGTANTATPDYFNICANYSTGVSTPFNSLGYQNPYAGNAYVGIFVYDIDNYREYLQGKLNYPLIKNHEYKCEFYVSYADISSIAIKTIGAYFSVTPIYKASSYVPFILQPQIENRSIYLTDSLNWIKISGVFISNGNEEYITIGNFRDTLNPDTLRTEISNPIHFASYYFIDAISLFDLTSENCIDKQEFTNVPNVFTPNNDEINDSFKMAFCDSTNFKLTIYNRWGLKIFETSTINRYWDGRTTSGEECVDGTYYYIIEVKEKNIKGFIQLIR